MAWRSSCPSRFDGRDRLTVKGNSTRDNTDRRLDPRDRPKPITGIVGDLQQAPPFTTKPSPYCGLEAGRLRMPTGRQPAIGQHQRDQLRGTHQNKL
jgi:hypothetical protein